MATIDLLDKIASNNGIYKNTYKKRLLTIDESVEQLQKNMKSFKKNVKSLKNYASQQTPKSKVARQFKDLAKSFTSLTKNMDDISDPELRTQLSELSDLFSKNEKQLKSIGLVQADNKLTFKEDIFDDAEDEFLDSLLIGKDCFIKQVDKILRKTEKCADDAKYDVVNRKISKTMHYSSAELGFAYTFESISALKRVDGAVQAGTLTTDQQKSITENLKLFSKHAFNVNESNPTDSQKEIQKLCELQKEKLLDVGILYTADNNLEFQTDPPLDMSTARFQTAFHDLFGANSTFGEAIQKYCQDEAGDLINLKKSGASLIDAYI